MLFSHILKSPGHTSKKEHVLRSSPLLRDDELFSGTYKDLSAARSAAPRGARLDAGALSNAWTLYRHEIHSWDYPALYWLADALKTSGHRIFDLGGQFGAKYYAYGQHLTYPASLSWTVCDAPEIVAVGEKVARQRMAPAHLSFCIEKSQASAADVLLVSGVLQYLPNTLEEILAQMPTKPQRVLINVTAVHPRTTIFTLSTIGCAVRPYRIQRQDGLLEVLARSGYRIRDVWRNEGKQVVIPFVNDSKDAYFFGCCADLI
ncbi:MAG: methyltransferase, TIGR04325 family [Variovorax paradoxus]|jgi:putative methyltransferase (TIGR04325 family)|uniref:Methyltransferase, TIGR04325 family n=1 Tax=Variovorax paradoxus TaxID=34073 RepID=A0A2W5QLR5_VARPD|nr:MAG: methyltransferase, TIGR04325 family [Variovorax paradoxus]